jgi:hypothetical protein
MDPKEIVISGILATVICVPVLGITARFALKPIVDSIIRLRESWGAGNAEGVVARRMLELEDEVRQLRSSVTTLEDTVAFQQKLLAAGDAPASAASHAAT